MTINEENRRALSEWVVKHSLNQFVFLMVLLSCTYASSAMSSTFTSNATYTDLGHSFNLSMSAWGGAPPYYFFIYNGNTDLMTSTSSSVSSYVVKPQFPGIVSYRLRVLDSGTNVTNTTLKLTVNSTPRITLLPHNITIVPFTNLTFTNTIIGGSPPFTYNYFITGGLFDRNNNTVTFNSIEAYSVNLTATDAFNVIASSISVILVAYSPNATKNGACEAIYNMSETQNATLQIGSNTLSVIENYIAPNFAAITVNGNHLIINATADVKVADGYYMHLLNLSWAPILHTVSFEFCPKPLLTTSTTSSTSTSTTSTSTSSTSRSTTKSTTSSTSTLFTTVPVATNQSSNSLGSASPQTTSLGWEIPAVAIIALVIIVVIGIIVWLFLKG